jgi:hypothetical protein
VYAGEEFVPDVVEVVLESGRQSCGLPGLLCAIQGHRRTPPGAAELS